MSSVRAAGDKIMSLDQAVATVAAWRVAGGTIVLANGVFDVLHVGHVRYLEGARRLGTHLVVGVNGDRATAALKGRGRPVLLASDRARLVAALRAVDLVMVFEEPTADTLLERVRPDVHAKGTDYRPDTVPERERAREVGARVAITGDPKRHSTRELVEHVRARMAGDA